MPNKYVPLLEQLVSSTNRSEADFIIITEQILEEFKLGKERERKIRYLFEKWLGSKGLTTDHPNVEDMFKAFVGGLFTDNPFATRLRRPPTALS